MFPLVSRTPCPQCLHTLKHIFACTNCICKYCLFYSATGNLFPHGFVDADLASDASDQKSISSYTFLVASCTFSWSSKKQQSVTSSTMEAEYHAVHMGSLNVLWIRQLFKQINIPFTTPLPLYCNNQAVIATVKAKQAHQHSKHINIKFHLIHEHIE